MTASHHGSKTANTHDLYENTTPNRVVIMAGAGRKSVPPHEEVFETLDRFEAATYWTNAHGNVTFTVDDGELFVAVEDAATTDPAEIEDEVRRSTSPELRTPPRD